jgi:uncharacterized membrane protein
MSLSEFLLTIHILGAIVWVGGSWMLLILGYSLRGADLQRRLEYTRLTEKVSSIVFSIASILVILAGSWLVDELGYDYSDTWVTLGYAGWFVSFLLGVGFYPREGKRREKQIEASGADGPHVSASIDRILRVATVDTIIVTLVVLDMTTKPGL